MMKIHQESESEWPDGEFPPELAIHMEAFMEDFDKIAEVYHESLSVINPQDWHLPSLDDLKEGVESDFLINRMAHIQLMLLSCYRDPEGNRWKINAMKRISEVFTQNLYVAEGLSLRNRIATFSGHMWGLIEIAGEKFCERIMPGKLTGFRLKIGEVYARRNPITHGWDMRQVALSKKASSAIQLSLLGEGDTFESGQLPFKVYLAMVMYSDFIDRMKSVTELHHFLCIGLGESLVGKPDRISKLCYRIGLRLKGKGAPRLNSDMED